MLTTKSDYWWSAFTAALAGLAVREQPDHGADLARQFAEYSVKAFAKRWPEQWDGMED
jgi:hypothetical protein